MCCYPRQNHGWQVAEIYTLFSMGESGGVSDDGVGEFKIIELLGTVLLNSLRYSLFDLLEFIAHDRARRNVPGNDLESRLLEG